MKKLFRFLKVIHYYLKSSYKIWKVKRLQDKEIHSLHLTQYKRFVPYAIQLNTLLLLRVSGAC